LSINDLQEEGEAVLKQLVGELKQIRSRDDLLQHAAKLQTLFNALVDVVIRTDEFKNNHPNASLESEDDRDLALSYQLRTELNRIMQMEGGREVIEKAQEEALNRLDVYEAKKK